VELMKDKAEDKLYCLEISIRRRPGAKLPESQKPEKDDWYLHHRLFNDLENGEDVDDADIKKAFPPCRLVPGRMARSTPPAPAGCRRSGRPNSTPFGRRRTRKT
jgi:hypothetical protein